MEGFAVEVFATSWIEISVPQLMKRRLIVEVFATSWIEILRFNGNIRRVMSRSLRPRGLKCVCSTGVHVSRGRGLCDLVD